MIDTFGVYYFCVIKFEKSNSPAFKATTKDNFWGKFEFDPMGCRLTTANLLKM